MVPYRDKEKNKRVFITLLRVRAPGTGVNLMVKVHCRRGSTSLLAEGKGVHREAESEGSRRQTPEPRNTNLKRGWLIRASLLDKIKPYAIKG